jgi:hypothetical protein
LLEQVREARRRGKPVAVGGPYPTALPHECHDADFLILDEGEVTLPLFLAAVERGETAGVFRSQGRRPDVTLTPVPRFDLLDLNAYSEMSVQFSRGCPFACEFCDIIVLYGRAPRTKAPAQMLAELERLYQLGWRRSVFVVDDNFIGNKGKVKAFLRELRQWMVERDYPFSFATEASLDLAEDQELMDLMVQSVFLLPGGIAHHYNRFRSLAIIRLRKHPPGVCAHAEHREVVSRNVLGAHRLCRLIARVAPDSHEAAPGLEGGQLGEAARPVAESFVLVVGEERPTVLKPSVHAAVLVVADANQFAGLGHRQGLQQNGVHQGENCGGRADPEGKGQHRRRREAGRVRELPHGIADIVHELHRGL